MFPTNFENKKVLIRVDFNVPFHKNKTIADDTRIRLCLPTIEKVIQGGGIPVLMSHLGRPKGEKNLKYSLKPVADYLKKTLATTTNLNFVKVFFAEDCIGETTEKKIASMKKGELILLENLRFYPEEENGDKKFAKQLSDLGDMYINDAFGSAHRSHASTTVIATFFEKPNKMFGLLMEAELANAVKVLKTSAKPFLAIIGGAKVSDKILILENLLYKANAIIIGGGMAYTFLKAQNFEIGKSICEEDKISTATDFLKLAREQGVDILLPCDHHISSEFDAKAQSQFTEAPHIPDNQMGMDIGPNSIQLFKKKIAESKTILWNGPMGVFEFENYQKGSKEIALAISKATSEGAFSLVGGGDSVAAVNKFGLRDKISFVSTGGGALLEFFEGKTLPGVAAMETTAN